MNCALYFTAFFFLFCLIESTKAQNGFTGQYSSAALKYRNLVKQLSEISECDLNCLKKITKFVKEKDFEKCEPKYPYKIGKNFENLRLQLNAEPVECVSLPKGLRFDCFPGQGSNPDSCASRNCCWESPGQNLEPNNYYDLYPREPPSCFYPPSYSGYQFTSSLNETDLGVSGVLQRDTASGYPNDVLELRFDVIFETESRIRIRIFDPSKARWETPLPVVPEVMNKSENQLYDLIITLNKGEFAIIRKDTSQPLFDTRGAAPLTFSDQFLQISSLLPSEYLYGLGQHLEGLLLDTYWHRRVLWNYDQGIKPDTNLYGSHPFYLCFERDGNAHGVFLLNSNTMDIIIQPAPAITFRSLGGIIDLYVFLGPTPSDVIQQYTDVIGKPFLPPYWSLGYHQCRYNYFSLNRTRQVWQQTRDAGIPYDVQWNDIDSLEDFRIFTYNLTNFAGLPEFVEELHSVYMKYIPIVDPGLGYGTPPGVYPPVDDALARKVIVVDENGNDYVGRAWPGDTVWPDFSNPDSIPYWAEQFQTYHDLVGYDGAWLDMNEPPDFSMTVDKCDNSSSLNNPPYLPPVEGGFLSYRTICMASQQSLGTHYNVHNLYSSTNCIATNNALKTARGQRPFIISRSSFPGLGKYAGHWTGDSESTYSDMYTSIADILNFNMYGIPMVGADICGFNLNTTIPLCTRWYLLGAFYPFSRNHNNEFCLPQDPVSLGEPIITVARNSMMVRYRLLPYLYSLFFRAHRTGEPVARALFYEFPGDIYTYTVDTEILWGKALLLAPALGNETFEVSAYIPKGLWYNWYTGSLEYDSPGDYYNMIAPEDTPNLFFRGGFIIPVQDPNVTTAQSRLGNFGLEIAVDYNQEAVGELFWDDGESLTTVQNAEFNQFDFFANASGLVTSSTIGYFDSMILNYVRVMGLKNVVDGVFVNGLPVPYTYQNEVLVVTNFTQSLLSDFAITW